MLRRVDSGTLTCTGATGTFNIGTVRGQIMKIEVVASASTDVWIYCDASDVNDGNIVDENILGLTGAKITVNTTLIVYPVASQYTGSNNTLTDPDQYIPMIVSGNVELAYASAAENDTLRVVIYYEPFN